MNLISTSIKDSKIEASKIIIFFGGTCFPKTIIFLNNKKNQYNKKLNYQKKTSSELTQKGFGNCLSGSKSKSKLKF